MAGSLLSNTSVLTSPGWKPGVVMFCDDEGVHVMSEDGDCEPHHPSAIAIVGSDRRPKQGEDVLVEFDGRWQRSRALDVHVTRVRVDTSEGEHWIPLASLAILFEQGSASRAQPSEQAEHAQTKPLKFNHRLRQFGWRYGALVLLGFTAIAPVLAFAQAGTALLGGAWVALHVILAAYVHALNRPLPRFHPAGFGKPSNPGARSGFELERPPIRGKWEVGVVLMIGWALLGASTLPEMPALLAPGFVAALGLGLAALAYLHDRHSASEVRRLLGGAPIRDGVDSSSSSGGCLTGTVVGVRDQPIAWRSVVLYVWSESRTVDKTITDSEGRTQTVQATETTTYACGLRREHEPATLMLDTPVGPVEVGLRGAIWAAEREVEFGPVPVKRPGYPDFVRIMRAHTKAEAREQIHAQDHVTVAGELRRDVAGRTRIVGGKGGPTLVFAAGDRDPRAVLVRGIVRRRALIAAMIVFGLAPLIVALVVLAVG